MNNLLEGSPKQDKFHHRDGFTCIKARYILALMCSLGLALQFCLNVCMSVAIVAMVKSPGDTVLTVTNQTEVDVCPGSNEKMDMQDREGDFDWDEKTQGFILSSYYYGYVTTQVLGGRAAETFGSKHVIGSGILLAGIFTLLNPYAARTHMYFLIALRILQGMAVGGVLPAMHSLFSKWFPPEERAQFSGIIFSAIHMGTVIAMSLTGILADFGDWPVVFYSFGTAAVVWYIPWVFLVYSSPYHHPYISDEEKSYILERLGSSEEKKVSLPVPWCRIFTSAPIWAVFLMYFGITWESYTLLTELPTYSKNVLHFNVRQSGFISAVPYLFDWISSFAAGFLSRWLRSRDFMSQLTTYRLFNGIVSIGGALCLYAITVVGCNSTVIMILLVLVLTTHGLFVAGSAMNHMDLAVNFSGTIIGITFTLSNIAGILAPSVIGIIINGQQTLTQWRLVFYIAIVVLIVPYVLYLIFGSVDEQPWNQPEKQPQKETGEDGHTNSAFCVKSGVQDNHNLRIVSSQAL